MPFVTISAPRHARSSPLGRIALALLDLAFARRVARVRRLRRAGRHGEADRVLRALQREIEGRHGGRGGCGGGAARP